MVQYEFNEATRTIFHAQIKHTILFNNLSPLLQRSTILENISMAEGLF